MYFLLQLLVAVIAIHSALNFTGDLRLYVPLGCLIAMFILGRLDKERREKREVRRRFLKSGIERISQKDPAVIQKQNFLTLNSLLWPKGELVLTEAVHTIFKDLGFRVAAGGEYHSVDRIVTIPDTQFCFGLAILMSEEEVRKNHPKIKRALQFEKERKKSEKTLIIASTYIRQPISEREKLNHVSTELNDFLTNSQGSLITACSLYQLWENWKGEGIDIFEVFQRVYSHPGGTFSSEEIYKSFLVSLGT